MKKIVYALMVFALVFMMSFMAACGGNANHSTESESSGPDIRPPEENALFGEDIFEAVENPWGTSTPDEVSEGEGNSVFTMGKATVKVAENYNESGLQFSASVAKADYQGLSAENYSNVSFGMVIAPASWVAVYQFNEENLFGENAKYCFEGAENGKARIINIKTEELASDGDNYVLSAGIVNFKAFNIAREFVGRAYIKYDKDGTTHYVFADYSDNDVANNVCSMAEVATDAIADISANALSAAQKETLRQQFTSKCVTVNHYFQDDNGEYKLRQISYLSGENGETVYAEPLNIAGYELNEVFQDSVTSGVINYNGTNPTLKLYYVIATCDVTFIAEDGQTVIKTETIVYGGESEYGNEVYGELREKRIDNAIYHFNGWVLEDGTDASDALESITSDLTVYESFSEEPVKYLDPETEKYLYCNRTVKGDNFAQRAVFFEVPDDSDFEDTFTLKFKVRYDGNRIDTVLVPIGGNGQEFGRGYYVDDAGLAWADVEFNQVPIKTTDSVLQGFKDGGWYDDWMAPLVYDIGSKNAGLVLWVHALQQDSLMEFKDIEVIKDTVLDPVVPDAEYMYKHAQGETNWGTLKLPATGYEVGDKVKVTFNVKTNITSEYVTLNYVNKDGANAITFGFGVLNTYTDWTEISVEAQVVTGATAKSKAKATWGDDMPGATVADDAVGIFFIVMNPQAGKIIWVKDYSLEKITETEIVVPDAEYSYTHAAGETRWGTLELPATGYEVGDKVKVTFKVKTDITSEWITLDYVNKDGADARPFGFQVLYTYTDWTEISVEAQVVTGATAKSKVKATWGDDMPGATVADDAVGIFFITVNYQEGKTIWVKDYVLEKITETEIIVPDVEYSYTHAAGETNWGTLELPATGYEVGDKVRVTFKLKTDITSEWVTLNYVNKDGANALTFGFQVLNTYTDWTEISVEAQVVTGATAKSKAKAAWGDDMPGATVADDAVGIFFITVNYQEGKTIWVKDYVIEEIVDYFYTHAVGETNWGTLELPATGYEVGDKVKVTFKVKTDITSEYVTLNYVNKDGANALTFGFSILNTYTDWTEISVEAQVVTGATAKSKAKATWGDDMPGATVADDAVGIFFITVNYQEGKTIWVKDFAIEQLA